MNILEDFINFVETMPADKEIDHNAGGDLNAWCNCAVGEFIRNRDNVSREEFDSKKVTALEVAMRGAGMNGAFELLNNSRPETYGQLAGIFQMYADGEVKCDYGDDLGDLEDLEEWAEDLGMELGEA